MEERRLRAEEALKDNRSELIQALQGGESAGARERERYFLEPSVSETGPCID